MRKKISWKHPWNAVMLRSVLMTFAVAGTGLSAVPAYAASAAPAAAGLTSAPGSIPGCLAGQIVGSAATPDGAGYWLLGSDGGVFSFGDARFAGSMGGKPLNKPMVAIVPTQSGNGYWEVAADGGVFAFGDAVAPASNPLPAMTLNAPIVGAARAGADGLDLVAADGGVFALGGAPFYGSMGGKPLNKPMVAIVPTQSGNGYWEVAADGGVFAFGDAVAPASNPLPAMTLNAPIVGAARAGADGLDLVAADGGVFALGGAPFYGSMGGKPLSKPITSITAAPGGNGYWLTGADGGVFSYGGSGFLGNAVGNPSCAIPAPGASSSKIVQYATDIMNGRAEPGWGGGSVPYSWGGGHLGTPGPSFGTCAADSGYSGPRPCEASSTRGVDCSGFARWVYWLAYGTDVLGGGNTDSELARMTKISVPQPGDLVFFGTHDSNGYHTHHVGIYIGNGNMINALETGTVAKVTQISAVTGLAGYWHY